MVSNSLKVHGRLTGVEALRSRMLERRRQFKLKTPVLGAVGGSRRRNRTHTSSRKYMKSKRA